MPKHLAWNQKTLNVSKNTFQEELNTYMLFKYKKRIQEMDPNVIHVQNGYERIGRGEEKRENEKD